MPPFSKYGRQVTATLPPVLVRRLDHWVISEQMYRTRSEVIAEAIERYLDAIGAPKEPE